MKSQNQQNRCETNHRINSMKSQRMQKSHQKIINVNELCHCLIDDRAEYRDSSWYTEWKLKKDLRVG